MSVSALPGARPAGVKAGAGLPVRQRRPGYVALALMLIIGFAALGGYLYMQAGAKTAVVVVVADVPQGHVIERADLSTVAVAGGVTAIAADHLDSVVGATAAVHLLPNMLLQRSMVAAGAGLAVNQAQVGVVVKAGQIPADGLAPGDTVEVVAVPPAAASGALGTPQILVEQARVFASRPDAAQSGNTLLTLLVPRSSATAVASASAAGQISLIRVAAR